MNLAKTFFLRQLNKIIRLYIPAILIGIFTGVLISALNHSLSIISDYRDILTKDIFTSPIKIIMTLLFLGVNIIVLSKLMNKFTIVDGSGIPHVKNMLIENNGVKSIRALIGKFAATLISLGSGASLGKFGPSILMGGKVGIIVSKLFKSNKSERLSLALSGISAGITAAFGAPFSGLMFVYEELRSHFSYLMMGCIITSTVVSHFVAEYLIDTTSHFKIRYTPTIQVDDYYIVVIFGIVITLIAFVFNKLLNELKSYFLWKSNLFKAASALILSLSSVILFKEISCGGINIIRHIINSEYSVMMLLLLFFMKLIFTLICCSSGIPGGTFAPILALGALIGIIYSEILVYLIDINTEYSHVFIFLGMFAFFIATSNNPITGCFLMVELTGSYKYIPLLIIIAISIYITRKFMTKRKLYKIDKKIAKQNLVGEKNRF